MTKRPSLLFQRFTDIGNCERLLATYPDQYRYSEEWRAWLRFDGKRWKRDTVETIYHCAKRTIQVLFEEAEGLPEAEKDFREQALQWARSSEFVARQNAMVTVARRDKRVRTEVAKLDRDEWAFNVENGTIDLRTGEIRPHNPSDLITKLSPITYEKGQGCPVFLKFLGRITGDQATLMDYHQRIIGYAMTAKTTEKAVFCFFGLGNNGKTSLLKIYRHIMGDYGTRVMSESLIDSRRSNANTDNSDLADLCGARFATTSEIRRGAKLSEHKVKDYTSMDVVKTRRMRENPFSFLPTHKFFVDTNYKPAVEGRDEGIWGRLRLVPFTITIPKAERDKELYTKLEAEAPGILNWMIEGCLKWQADGLQEPEEITEATAGWKQEDDFVQQFVEDCCELDDEFCTPVDQLSREFADWSDLNAAADVKKSDLIQWLRHRGQAWGTRRTIEGRLRRVVDGIRLCTYVVNYRIVGKTGTEEVSSVKKGVKPEVTVSEPVTDKLTIDIVH